MTKMGTITSMSPLFFLLLALTFHSTRSQQSSLLSLAPPSLVEEGKVIGGSPASVTKPVNLASNSFMSLPPFAPISPRIPGERCRADSQLFLKELGDLNLWAAEMFDASGKFPTGLLHGSTLEAGNYDECMTLSASGDSRPISAKYCLSTIRLRLPDSLIPHDQRPPSFWDRIKNSTLNPSHKRRDLLQWGLCIPSSCSALDIQVHLQHALEPLLAALGGGSVVGTDIDKDDGPIMSVKVEESNCQKSDIDGPNASSRPLETGEIIVGTFFAMAAILVLAGTAYDVIKRIFPSKNDQFKKKGLIEKYIMCFSAYANGLKIFKDENNSNSLKFLNGVKCYSICMIIMGHRLFFSLGGPILNSHYVEQFYKSFEVVLLLGGPIVVDTFFTISGCLLSFIILTEYQKFKASLSLPILYINRFIRLTPLYMAVVGLYATLLPRITSGPLWQAKVFIESERCAKNWWTNLLYINNFVDVNHMCMLQSWYLSSDMQLFIIGAPIALLLAKRPNLGKIVLGLFLTVAAILPFALTYILKLQPIFPVYMETVKDLLANEAYLTTYVPTYMRGAPYFIGMIVGYLIYEHQKHPSALSGKTVILGYILCTTAMLGSLIGSWAFYAPGWTYDPLSAAFYASLHRICWSCGIAWGIYALATGNGWLFGWFFGWKRIFPLGRLTYSTFLVHCGLQLIDVGSLRAPLYMSIFNMTLSVLADIVLSFLLGFTMSLLFEAPILSVQRVLLASKIGKEKKEEAVVAVIEERRGPVKQVDAISMPPPPYIFNHHDNRAFVHKESQDVHL